MNNLKNSFDHHHPPHPSHHPHWLQSMKCFTLVSKQQLLTALWHELNLIKQLTKWQLINYHHHGRSRRQRYGEQQRRQRHSINNNEYSIGKLINNKLIVPFYLVVIIIIVNNINPATGRTLYSPILESASKIDLIYLDTTLDFMKRYGYLGEKETKSNALLHGDYLRDALKRMQRFGGIPETGVIDENTVRLLSRPRCGLPDELESGTRRKRYLIQGSKWDHTNLTWSIKVTFPGMDHNEIRRELHMAFKVWSDASVLRFRETSDPKADIVVSFLAKKHGDSYPFDGKGYILAHAFYPGEDVGGDVHFDADEKWTITRSEEEVRRKNDGGVGLAGVAAHELGHSLGLGHSSVSGSLMFPYYQHFEKNFVLPYDDTIGIHQIYGTPGGKQWAPLPTHPTRRTTTSPPSHRPHHPHHPHVPTESDKPDTCNTTFDAASVIRNQVFFFKGHHFWRLYSDKKLEREYANEVSQLWKNLPKKRIDAVYERSDHKIVFFIGDKYYMFDGNQLINGYPKPLTDLGLPAYVKQIDAAFIWGYNNRAYFFRRDQYWRFDEKSGKVDLDYPRHINIWKGIPYSIDAALVWNGVTYFFKDDIFFKFDDRKMRVEEGYPKGSLSFWFESSCRDVKPNHDFRQNKNMKITDEESSEHIRSAVTHHNVPVLSLNFTLFIFYCSVINTLFTLF